MVGICHRLGLAQASFERGTAIDATAPQDVFPGDGAFFFVVAHGCVLLRHVFLVLWQFVVAHVCVAVLFPGLSCCFCGMPVRLRSVTGVRLKVCVLTRCFACNAATWLASAMGDAANDA